MLNSVLLNLLAVESWSIDHVGQPFKPRLFARGLVRGKLHIFSTHCRVCQHSVQCPVPCHAPFPYAFAPALRRLHRARHSSHLALAHSRRPKLGLFSCHALVARPAAWRNGHFVGHNGRFCHVVSTVDDPQWSSRQRRPQNVQCHSAYLTFHVDIRHHFWNFSYIVYFFLCIKLDLTVFDRTRQREK